MGGTAVLDAPPPAATEPPIVPRPFIVNFRHVDTGGRPRQHSWLPPTIVVDGCLSAEDAKRKVLEMVAAAVFQVEPARH